MPPKTRIAAALAIPLAAAGCSWFEPEAEDLDFAEYEQQLTETYNESVRLSAELDAAEHRIIQSCLEAQGFTVHDPSEFIVFEEERDSFMDQPPYLWFLPTAEEAERRGFWQWAELGTEDVEDGEALAAENEAFKTGMGWLVFDAEDLEPQEGPEFDTLSEDERFAWYVAYGGEAWATAMQPELAGVEEPETGEDDEGEAGNPPLGGCKLEMIEAVYGGLEEGEDEYSVRPDQPDGNWSAMNERYREGTAEAENAFLDCLDGRGHAGWEFYEGQILVHSYLVEAGDGEYPLTSYPDAGVRWPDPPTDVPDEGDAQGWLDFERALAVDFAECGDESGFRKAAEHAWQQAQLRYYLDIEGATFAWQAEMRDLIERAQEVIGG
ncbi:hypothetical protein [Glycomyces albidus]|uniref:Uncharacterized protein n=1 Tax=Glycomyces albidus TaxID=2656774 RepID=A0A6L5G4G8_9ACTN|nr:hypothetical protein [Glycomyces albidus]MQM24521.1 hypothetical protein [Glycomyces albidus]